MAKNSRRIHDVNPRETLDRFAFLLAFVLGAVGGIVLKVMGAHPFASAGWAASVLIAYAFTAWAVGRIKIEPETIGDNCYYLGFLFTLASLSYTLYQMADPSINGGQAIQIPEVISGFGVALSSTIVGVFLRVFLMQMRPDFIAKDREMRADVNRAFSDFKRSLSDMQSQMKAFATQSIQLAAERDGRIRETTEAHIKDHHAKLIEASGSFSKQVENALSEGVAKSMEELSAAIQAINKATQKQVEDAVEQIHALGNRLAEQEERLAQRSESRRTEILEREKETIAEILERNQNLATSVNALSARFKQQEAAMGNFTAATLRISQTLQTNILPVLDNVEARLRVAPLSQTSDMEGSVEKKQPFEVTGDEKTLPIADQKAPATHLVEPSIERTAGANVRPGQNSDT